MKMKNVTLETKGDKNFSIFSDGFIDLMFLPNV